MRPRARPANQATAARPRSRSIPFSCVCARTRVELACHRPARSRPSSLIGAGRALLASGARLQSSFRPPQWLAARRKFARLAGAACRHGGAGRRVGVSEWAIGHVRITKRKTWLSSFVGGARFIALVSFHFNLARRIQCTWAQIGATPPAAINGLREWRRKKMGREGGGRRRSGKPVDGETWAVEEKPVASSHALTFHYHRHRRQIGSLIVIKFNCI